MTHAYLATQPAQALPPPTNTVTLWHRLFGDAITAIATVATLALLAVALGKTINWGVLQAVWPDGDAAACRAASGACWAFLSEKLRQILFGIYPPGEQWRPALTSVILLVLGAASLPPVCWGKRLVLAWLVGIVTVLLLMRGGVLGLAEVPTAAWGGLPVTLLLAVFALGAGFPLGILLALGRRAEMPVPRMLSIGVIEIIRGLPLVSLLFVASILLPLMLPDGMSIDGLLRAGAALTVFSAAYLAEVVRGGLQSLPRGQGEASRALGLSWWMMTRLVVLPQALRSVLAPLTNTAIVMIKNTSLVLIVGLFDLLSSGRAALADPAWPTPYVETYCFIAAIYFTICFSLSRYSMWLEARYSQHRSH